MVFSNTLNYTFKSIFKKNLKMFDQISSVKLMFEIYFTGNGIQSVTGGNLSPTPEYNGKNLLVPGTGSASSVKISLIMLLLSIFVNNIT